MKSPLLKSSLTVVLVCAAGVFASGCQQDPQSANGPVLPSAQGSSGSSTAHPALTYIDQVNTGTNHNPVLVWVLKVSDSDATHKTTIYTASSSSETVSQPSWAPGGGSICYLDGTGLMGLALKAVDVSVNSNGVAVGSNFRTIYAPSSTDSVRLYWPRWCEQSSTAAIVFVRVHYNASQLHLWELCTVSASGGSVTVLDSIQDGKGNSSYRNFQWPCWSPDDSKIGLCRQDTSGQWTLMIYNASNGNALDSISLHSSSLVPSTLRWSHTGNNELAYNAQPWTGGTSYIYYCAPTTGSTPTTNNVHGFNCWSPTNSSLLVSTQAAYLQKLTPHSTTLTNVSTNFPFIGPIDWKH